MKSILIAGMTVTVIIFIVCLLLVGKCSQEVQKELDKPKEKVGKTYVIGKDTVTVMDYSLLHSTYKLSNGKEVAFAFMDSLTPVK